MTQPDLSQSQECTKPTIAECSFCSNTSESDFDVEYPMTGLVHHCRACAIEYGVDQSYPQKLSTPMLMKSDTPSDQHF